MRLRTWLLTGTSLGFLALSPFGAAQAQDVGAAYQALVDAQASGDPAAVEAAQTALTEACITGGFASVDECVASAMAATPMAEPTPEVVEEPAVEPEVVEEPAVEPEVVEEPAPEVVEEVAPEVVAEPEVIEEPVAEPEVIEETQPEVVEEVAPEVTEEVAPEVTEEVTPEVTEEVAPEATEEVAPEITEETAPEVTEEVAPDVVVEQTPDAGADEAELISALEGQVQLYNDAVATMMSGGDAAIAQQQATDAKSEIDALCAQWTNFASTDECLANYGLALPAIPALEEAVPPQPETEVVEPTPDVVEPTPEAEVVDPATLPVEPVEEITDLPEGITQEDVAPLFDSAKDEQTLVDTGMAPAPDAGPVAEEPAVPAPTTDAEAQVDVGIAPETITSVIEEQGEQIDAAEAAPVPETPDNVTMIDQVGNSFVFEINGQIFINDPFQDEDRISYGQDDETFYERLPGGRVRETIERPNGTLIITVYDRNGNVLRKSRITPDGREYILAYFDEQYEDGLYSFVDPGDELPPLRLNIPARDYVLDAEDADEDEVADFFSQPPVEQVRRLYSIDEVKRSARIRDSVRRLEVGGLTFDSGKATISRDQVSTLSKVAAAMIALLEDNPAETFLIEGHTDAVGSDLSNLRLSDARAATIARVLTDFYDIPPENLVTQGYGERYLKIKTEEGERVNRRVTVRRITPLITLLVAN